MLQLGSVPLRDPLRSCGSDLPGAYRTHRARRYRFIAQAHAHIQPRLVPRPGRGLHGYPDRSHARCGASGHALSAEAGVTDHKIGLIIRNGSSPNEL